MTLDFSNEYLFKPTPGALYAEVTPTENYLHFHFRCGCRNVENKDVERLESYQCPKCGREFNLSGKAIVIPLSESKLYKWESTTNAQT